MNEMGGHGKQSNGYYSSSEAEQYHFAMKVMLLGDSCTGKTCLLIRFKDNTFLNNNFISTVGIDYRNKIIDVDNSKVKLQGQEKFNMFQGEDQEFKTHSPPVITLNGVPVEYTLIHQPHESFKMAAFCTATPFQIWDTAGQERFRSVTHTYYRDADALLLVFDVTSRPSFENIRNWLSEVKEYAKDRVLVTLVGNKTDLSASRKVKTEEAKKLADDYGIAYMETSAKTGANVAEAFTTMARNLINSRVNIREKATTDHVDLNESKLASYTSWCCGRQ